MDWWIWTLRFEYGRMAYHTGMKTSTSTECQCQCRIRREKKQEERVNWQKIRDRNVIKWTSMDSACNLRATKQANGTKKWSSVANHAKKFITSLSPLRHYCNKMVNTWSSVYEKGILKKMSKNGQGSFGMLDSLLLFLTIPDHQFSTLAIFWLCFYHLSGQQMVNK